MKTNRLIPGLLFFLILLAGCGEKPQSSVMSPTVPVTASNTLSIPSLTLTLIPPSLTATFTPAVPTRTPTAIPTITRTPTPVSKGLVKALNIPYAVIKGVDPNLISLDIYAPETANLWPVIVMIHGGAWVEGDKANYSEAFYKPVFFTSQGFVYISINYRLSPAVTHPVHVQDVAQALAWIHANIRRYNGDPERIFISGHSAGAHLAALVACDERYLKVHGLGLDMIKGVILLDGAGYDIPKLMKVNDGLQDMYITAFGSNSAVWRSASPVTHAAPGKNIPPFLLFTAGMPPTSFVLSDDLAQALRASDVSAEVVTEPNKNHGTITSEIGRPGDSVTEKMMRFLAGLID